MRYNRGSNLKNNLILVIEHSILENMVKPVHSNKDVKLDATIKYITLYYVMRAMPLIRS